MSTAETGPNTGLLKDTRPRSCYCGEVREDQVGREITLYGWVWRWRDHGGLIFIDLRDRTGHCQIVFHPDRKPELHSVASRLRSEYVVAVTGLVARRPEGMANDEIPTGKVELLVNEMVVLNTSETPPFDVADSVDAGEELRLRYRYLDLRRPVMQKMLLTRSRAAMATRNYLTKEGFLEVETPVLAKSTPEGARDYLVPSRVNKGLFYALPQSPQIFKQILMISGIDKYFQIVRCFRDEDLRADRQPEFTQIDIECSFIRPEDIYQLADGLTAAIFHDVLGLVVSTPFPRISYREAMDRYGSDKPDVRFGLELRDVGAIMKKSEFQVFQRVLDSGGVVKGLNLKGCAGFSRKEIDDLAKEAATYGAKGMSWIKVAEKGLESSLVKFLPEAVQDELRAKMEAETGDLLIFVADLPGVANPALSTIRNLMGKRLNLYDPKDYAFIWVTEFPLFEKDDRGNPTPSHHPFTSPLEEDLAILESDPFKVRSAAYDLALNGYEVAGGSIRIHRPDVQQRIFRMIGISDADAEDRFGFLLNAFRYGAPPHGGIAYGFDRLVMLLCGVQNIRDVIAFPKTQKALSLMDGAPSTVDDAQLRELGIQLCQRAEE